MEKLLQGIVRFRQTLRPSLLPGLRQVAEKVAPAQQALAVIEREMEPADLARTASDTAFQEFFWSAIREPVLQPKTALVACIDCRIMPETYMGSTPGDMFVVRTAGNMLPHAKLFGEPGGASEIAGLEMAIVEGKVENVVICGHSNCKGMDFLYSDSTNTDNYYLPWLKKHGASSLTKFERLEVSQDSGTALVFEDPSGGEPLHALIDQENKLSKVNKLSQVNVLQQLHNLKSFPFITTPLLKGKLHLYGLWFDIKEGEMYMFSKQLKRFVAVTDESVKSLCSEVCN